MNQLINKELEALTASGPLMDAWKEGFCDGLAIAGIVSTIASPITGAMGLALSSIIGWTGFGTLTVSGISGCDLF